MDNLDEIVKKELGKKTFEFKPEYWDEALAVIEAHKKKRMIWWWAGGIAAFLLLGGGLYWGVAVQQDEVIHEADVKAKVEEVVVSNQENARANESQTSNIQSTGDFAEVHQEANEQEKILTEKAADVAVVGSEHSSPEQADGETVNFEIKSNKEDQPLVVEGVQNVENQHLQEVEFAQSQAERIAEATADQRMDEMRGEEALGDDAVLARETSASDIAGITSGLVSDQADVSLKERKEFIVHEGMEIQAPKALNQVDLYWGLLANGIPGLLEDPIEQPVNPQKKFSLGPTSYGVSAGATFNRHYTLPTARQFGVGMSFMPGLFLRQELGGKWALGLGVEAYQYQARNTDKTFERFTYGFGYTAERVTYSERKLFYASTPLYLEYMLKDQHALRVGASFGYLTATRTKITTTKEGSFIPSEEQFETKWAKFKGFNTLDYGLMLGYGRTLVGRLGGSLDVYYGLTDITDDVYHGVQTLNNNMQVRFRLTYKLSADKP